MKNCQLCDMLVLSDAKEAVPASGCFEEQLWMGNYCPSKNHSRRLWRGYCASASPNSGCSSVTTYSSVGEALTPQRAQLARMKNGLGTGRLAVAIWHPSTRKVKNDDAAGQSKRKEKCKITFSVQNAFKLQQPENCDPLLGAANIPAIWRQLRITRH